MARPGELIVAQSLMERLSEREAWPASQSASVRMLKEAIRRDLEAVLNTRRSMARELDSYKNAATSVLNFGLDDPGSLRTTVNGFLQEMQRAVQLCVAVYEPRLTHVTVSLRDGNLWSRQIQMHIEATLPLHPATEIVSFDTIFDLASETYTVG